MVKILTKSENKEKIEKVHIYVLYISCSALNLTYIWSNYQEFSIQNKNIIHNHPVNINSNCLVS